jgi:DNA (cytosine-5)-methyltransferase 1
MKRARRSRLEDQFDLHLEASEAITPHVNEKTCTHGVYYNELAPFPLAWLRELGAVGAIPDGVFDGRSIEDVLATDLLGHRHCHFFAGIGVWSFALEQAGWPRNNLTVWSASLPCQPFSSAGRKKGFEDPRHLWPVLFRLVQRCLPSIIVGEQTSSPDGLAWVDVVSAQLEGEGYAFGAVDLSAAGFGSPQKRQRLYWWAARMADAAHIKRELQRNGRRESRRWEEPVGNGRTSGAPRPTAGFWGDVVWLDCADGSRRPTKPGLCTVADRSPAGVEQLRGFGNALNAETAIGFAAALRETLSGADLGRQAC